MGKEEGGGGSRCRDEHAPFTPEELEEIKRIYPTLPSYSASDQSIGSADLGELYRLLRWPRSEEQLRVYKEAWDTVYGGRCPLDLMLMVMASCHTTVAFMRDCIKVADKNKDGFIQEDEFDAIVKVCQVHCPGWKKSFGDFVDEADTNRDGKVSIDEAVAWFERFAGQEEP